MLMIFLVVRNLPEVRKKTITRIRRARIVPYLATKRDRSNSLLAPKDFVALSVDLVIT